MADFPAEELTLPTEVVALGGPASPNLAEELLALGAGLSVVYVLGATDTGAGRRYWQSSTIDFASAPTPVGAWDFTSLVLLVTRTIPS